MNQSLEDLDKNILDVRSTYQSKGAMKGLQDQIDDFSGLTHVEYLRNDLLPKVV